MLRRYAKHAAKFLGNAARVRGMSVQRRHPLGAERQIFVIFVLCRSQIGLKTAVDHGNDGVFDFHRRAFIKQVYQIIPAAIFRDQLEQTERHLFIFSGQTLENHAEGTSFAATLHCIPGEEQPKHRQNGIFIVCLKKSGPDFILAHISHARKHKIQVNELFTARFIPDRAIFGH